VLEAVSLTLLLSIVPACVRMDTVARKDSDHLVAPDHEAVRPTSAAGGERERR
jgi:hypothetical protein